MSSIIWHIPINLVMMIYCQLYYRKTQNGKYNRSIGKYSIGFSILYVFLYFPILFSKNLAFVASGMPKCRACGAARALGKWFLLIFFGKSHGFCPWFSIIFYHQWGNESSPIPIGSMYDIYMVTFTINIPPMLVYIPYMDPMGYANHGAGIFTCIWVIVIGQMLT